MSCHWIQFDKTEQDSFAKRVQHDTNDFAMPDAPCWTASVDSCKGTLQQGVHTHTQLVVFMSAFLWHPVRTAIAPNPGSNVADCHSMALLGSLDHATGQRKADGSGPLPHLQQLWDFQPEASIRHARKSLCAP